MYELFFSFQCVLNDSVDIPTVFVILKTILVKEGENVIYNLEIYYFNVYSIES